MSGILGVAVWVVAAALEPMPVSLRWTCLVCGTLALLVSSFVVWRKVYHEARPYEKETFEFAERVFKQLSEDAKGLLEQMAIRKLTIHPVEAQIAGLSGTDFLVTEGERLESQKCRLHPEYVKIVARLVKEWRQDKGK
jgi:hypothetical protein